MNILPQHRLVLRTIYVHLSQNTLRHRGARPHRETSTDTKSVADMPQEVYLKPIYFPLWKPSCQQGIGPMGQLSYIPGMNAEALRKAWKNIEQTLNTEEKAVGLPGQPFFPLRRERRSPQKGETVGSTAPTQAHDAVSNWTASQRCGLGGW